MFSQFARKVLFSRKIMKHFYNILYITFLHTLFPTLSAIFVNVLIICSWEKGIYHF